MNTPYDVRMDSEKAKELTERGGALLLLDVPTGTNVAIDQQSFVVGPKFRGVKMLPPGMHHVAYSAAASEGPDFAPTASFFFAAAPRGVLVKRWDTVTELLLDLESPEEEERYVAGVKRFDFDGGLAPYDLASYNRWRALSSHITAEDIDRLRPAGDAVLCISAEADPAVLKPSTPAEEKLYRQLADGRAARAARTPVTEIIDGGQGDVAMADAASSRARGDAEIEVAVVDGSSLLSVDGGGVGRSRFLQLPRWFKSPGDSTQPQPRPLTLDTAGASPAELTAANLDKSPLLERAIESCGGREGALLGELQYAFLTFLMGQSLEGFAQWKDILQLLLSCEEAPLRTRIAFYVQFLTALHTQLQQSIGQEEESPQAAGSMAAGIGAFIEELLPDSFLRHAFGRFFEMLSEADPGAVPQELALKATLLRKQLEASLSLRFDVLDLDEEDEYAPVVVDLAH